jgi:polyisoprenyl-phosphate glycosyltransferase
MSDRSDFKRHPKLCSICLPVYNEQEGLPIFLDQLTKNLNNFEKCIGIEFEIIAVDDGSTDTSLSILKNYADKDKRLRVFAFQQNSGHQAAILCGLAHAKGDLIITMDSDGQDPPESIDRLINAHLQSHHEIIVAKRLTRKDGVAKKVTAYIFYRLLVLLGVPSESRDAGDYRLVTKRIKDLILAQPNSLQYIRGQIFTLKTATRMVNIDRKDRIAGETKYTFRKMARLAISSAFVIDPLKVAEVYISIAVLFATLSAFGGAAFLIVKVTLPGYYTAGITTLALMILFLFTIVIAMIAFQSLYMSLLFRSLRNEPAYLEKNF